MFPKIFVEFSLKDGLSIEDKKFQGAGQSFLIDFIVFVLFPISLMSGKFMSLLSVVFH